MKRILKDTCLLSSLMILAVFGLSVIWSGITAEIRLVFLLFLLAFVLSAANWFLDEYLTLSVLMSYVVKYFAASAIVMLFGFIVGWFYPSNFWMTFIYVGIVLILAYFLDSFLIRKDLEYINKSIRDREGGNEPPSRTE